MQVMLFGLDNKEEREADRKSNEIDDKGMPTT